MPGESSKMRTEHLKRSSAMRRKQGRPFRKLARKSVKNGMKRREETGPGPKSSAARAHRRLPKPAGSRLPVTLAWAVHLPACAPAWRGRDGAGFSEMLTTAREFGFAS